MKKFVKYWLILGCFLVLGQILIGGVTRLTGSGLSITKWEIVTGTLPPLSEGAWQEAFGEYKATPQYEKINVGMSLQEFKFIYFWEYFHRLWARMMGFIFLIPFLFFYWRGLLSKELRRSLLWVIGFAVLAAAFGWIMVASGLIDRPWVNAYKLSIHLGLGVAVFISLLLATLTEFEFDKSVVSSGMKRVLYLILIVSCVQIIFGGLMSGMKAGLFYPTWPEIGTELFPQFVLNKEYWSVNGFIEYDRNSFVPAVIHILHRTTAYIIFLMAVLFTWRIWKERIGRTSKRCLFMVNGLLITQIILGIITVLECKGAIPVLWGALHQIVGVLFLGAVVVLYKTLERRV